MLSNLPNTHNSQAPKWLEVGKGSLAKYSDLINHGTRAYLTLLIKTSAASQLQSLTPSIAFALLVAKIPSIHFTPSKA